MFHRALFRLSRLRQRAREATEAFKLQLLAALAERILLASTAEGRAQHSGRNEEDAERELADWPSLVGTGPVDWGTFRNDPLNFANPLEDRRAQYVEQHVLSRSFSALARAWKEAHQEARNLAQLPHDADGIHEAFAGPIMYRELWLVRFVLVYTLGIEPSLSEALGKRVINEWHGLDPDLGLTDEERRRLMAGNAGEGEQSA